ncbi:MAG TPA: restriction endonuclease subunit S [Rhodocyclaceae bacterium]|uniref:restriction endonuclease subunit S n=1 Tax=Accumulibacter sp. TaxID=2053492 RepID=UPI0025F82FDC|nr:restriction endonuclease subunit S [Accumulibacter sp.]HMV00951.1 restriction endonuclease subunit S [Rhodocyclaceae bacterium]MCM8598761.1 restriction endonuclease subunit S [Accumulibacter sp.]MCM8663616.1 restriction endonuclease subunit S [Accumulibacter sp.]HNC51828.1 restriction endonuclease subunit S [Accumulibacter sp.]HNL22478.1 restriction endonuclease subunit S [Rhodocyclaceae bacterium]
MTICAEDLPSSWCKTAISEVCTVNPTLDKLAVSDDLEVSFVPMPAVAAGTGAIDVSELRKFSEVKKGYTAFQYQDVLFAKITPCMENGKMAVVPEVKNGLGFGSTEFHVLRAHSGVIPEYVYYFVSSDAFRHEAEANMSGAVGQRRVPTPYLSNCNFPLPPTTEQLRIVAKIEELFSELDKGIESLKTAQSQLKVYRQALLKHAFDGKLSAQWRAENSDKLDTAEALLERIRRERTERHKRQLAAWETGKKLDTRPKAPKPLPPLTPEECAELPELPLGWAWVKVGELGTLGTGVTPLKSRKEFYEGGTIPWVTSGALNASYVTKASDVVTDTALRETKLRLYPKHTLLVALYGEGKTRGKCSELLIEATTNQAIAAILLEGIAGKLRPYVKWFFQKNYGDIRMKSSGGVQPNLNLGIVENTAVPICSLEEALQLVETLESRLSEVDQLDQILASALQQADALRQSILKKAFSGQLVPQDPQDEPASTLLARIKAARESSTKRTAATTGRRTRKAAA